MDFRVLGPIEVDVGGSLLDLGGPQQRVVLASLVLRANQVVSTDVLCEAVWGDLMPRSASTVVRTYVSRLRRAMRVAGDAPLTSRPPGFVLTIDPDWVDANRFVQLVDRARGDRDAGRPDRAVATLNQALGLWRGDALADVAGWSSLRPDVVRLEELRLAALEDRLDAELDMGRHGQAVGELETLTRAHPFRERLWGQLIVALYRSNRQAAALAAYRAARTALVDEMGIEPSPELQALERDVLTQSERLDWHPASTHRAPDPARPSSPIPLQVALAEGAHDEPLVGREDEQAALRAALEGLTSGGSRGSGGPGGFGVVFVAGPPGIGKTALAQWFAREARAAGSTVLFGRADEESASPFQALEEALDHWVAHADDSELEALGRSDAAHLARVVPRLAERRPDVTSVITADTLATRQRLFEALMRSIETLAARRPAVIVLDDLQWAGAATLAAVRHALRHPPAAAALVVATYRDTEIASAPELSAVVAGPDGRGRVRHLGLAGLADQGVVDLVQREARRPLDAGGRRFAEQLGRRTGGNPLFVIETVRHLAERGAIGGDIGGGAAGVPARVALLIDQRLRRLPPPTVDVLKLASVVGEQIDVTVLSRMAGTTEVGVLDALDPALTAQLVTASDEGPGRFAFAHALIREAVLAGLSLSRRSRLHWQAGQALAAVFAADPRRHLGDIARHLTAGVHSGEVAAAVAANVRAGQHGLSTLAFEEARDRFTAATELLATAGPGGAGDPQLAYDAWLGLGRAGVALADAELQWRGHMRAAAIAWHERWTDHLPPAAVGLDPYYWGPLPEGRTETPEAAPLPEAALLEETMAVVAKTPSVAGCILLAIHTNSAVIFNDREGANRQAEAAADAARRLDDPSATAAAQVARAWALIGTPRSGELRTAVEQASSLPLSAEAGSLLTYLLLLLPQSALQEGDRARFASIRSKVEAEPDAWGAHARSALQSWDVMLALCRGQFDHARRLMDSFPGAHTWGHWRLATMFQRSTCDYQQGRFAEVKELTLRWLSLRPRSVALRAHLARFCVESGETDEANHHLAILRGELDRLDEVAGGGPGTLRALAELAARRGDRALAGALLPRLSGFAGQMLVSFACVTLDGAADCSIGQLLLTVGRVDEAVERLAAAEAFERSFGAEALAARTAYWHARAQLRRNRPGDRAAARTLLTRARSDTRRLGMPRLLADIDALLGDLP